MRNLYEILEVTETASDEVIKMAYKALVKKYHPDVYQGDKKFAEAKMKELNEAYDILSNSEKRAQYDFTLRDEQRNTQQDEHAYTRANDGPRQTASPPPQDSPPPQQTYSQPRRGCLGTLFHGVWKLVKVAAVLLIIYGIFSGKIFSFFGNREKQSVADGPLMATTMPSPSPTDTVVNTDTEAAIAVKAYLNALQQLDEATAKSYVRGERLAGVTTDILSLYQPDPDPKSYVSNMITAIRSFNFTIQSPLYSEESTKATVDVELKVRNLYTVMTVAILNWQEKLEDEDWVTEYILSAAMSGRTDVDEMTILKDCVDEILESNIDDLKYVARFTLEKLEGRWVITATDDDIEFENIMSGYLTKYAESIGVLEIPNN